MINSRYRTPAAFKKAIEHRLRLQATVAGRDIHRFRQLFIFERFLIRVFKQFGEQVMLKGGVVLELRLTHARTTKDIDLRMLGNPNNVIFGLQEAGRMVLSDYLIFECREDPKHPRIEGDGIVYEGLRFRVQAFLAGKIFGFSFGVDISFADAIVESPEIIEGSDMWQWAELETTLYRVYPITSHIAEKLHAYTLPRARENSRVKDLPDLALLAQCTFCQSHILNRAIHKTFEHRNTHALPVSLPSPPIWWEPVYEKIAQQELLPWSNLTQVYHAAKDFLDPVLSQQQGQWNPTLWRWESQANMCDSLDDATGPDTPPR